MTNDSFEEFSFYADKGSSGKKKKQNNPYTHAHTKPKLFTEIYPESFYFQRTLFSGRGCHLVGHLTFQSLFVGYSGLQGCISPGF